MERKEFNEVLEMFDIDNALSTTMGRYGSMEDVHYWNNCAIYFSGSYYAIINGKIPFEIAQKIYEKYPENEYKIRIKGGSESNKPIDYAVDDKYKKELRDISKYYEDDFINKVKQADKKLKRRNNDNKYIESYDVDTKQGLIILLIEMENYNMKQEKNSGKQYTKKLSK